MWLLTSAAESMVGPAGSPPPTPTAVTSIDRPGVLRGLFGLSASASPSAKLEEPGVVGVPVMVRAPLFSVMPAGSAPDWTLIVLPAVAPRIAIIAALPSGTLAAESVSAESAGASNTLVTASVSGVSSGELVAPASAWRRTKPWLAAAS